MKILSCLFYVSCFLFCCILAAVAILAQENKPITNDDIVQMLYLGFEEETIIKAIQANDTSFDTSIQALLILKDAGLSEKIIAAMLEARASSKSQRSSTIQQDSKFPHHHKSCHRPRYLVRGNCWPTRLEPAYEHADVVTPIAIERIAPQLYRITPNRELDDGEYGFIGTFTYAGSGMDGSSEQIYDFGVPKRR